MNTVYRLFLDNLRYFETRLSKLVALGQGDKEEANSLRTRIEELAHTQKYGNSRNQNVLTLVKNHSNSYGARHTGCRLCGEIATPWHTVPV